jgi:cysteine-rich repeat protein
MKIINRLPLRRLSNGKNNSNLDIRQTKKSFERQGSSVINKFKQVYEKPSQKKNIVTKISQQKSKSLQITKQQFSKSNSLKKSKTPMIMGAVVVFLVIGLVTSLFLFNSQKLDFSDVPEGVPLPSASDLARANDVSLAGQGFSTGSYDHEFQFYMNIYNDATSQNAVTTTGYCVSCSQAWKYMDSHFVGGYFNWNQATKQTERILTPLTLNNNDGSDFTFATVAKDNPNGVGVKYELRSECADYDIEVDGSGNYYVSRNGKQVDTFNAPINGWQKVMNRQIASTDDAISVKYTTSGLSWMVLHCDEAVLPPAPLTPTGPVCGNGVIEDGERCDDGNNIEGDGCSINCLNEATLEEVQDSISGQFIVTSSFNNLDNLNLVVVDGDEIKPLANPNQYDAETLGIQTQGSNLGYIVEFATDSVIDQVLGGSQTPILTASDTQLRNLQSQIKLKKKTILNEQNTLLNDNNLQNNLEQSYTYAFNGVKLDIDEATAQNLKTDSRVKEIYPDFKVKTTLSTSVPLINAPTVWQQQDSSNRPLTGQGVKIAIIDTGVDYTHPDLGGCTTQQFTSGTCAKVIGGWDFVNNDNDPMDDQGHGTHCAATAAGNGVLQGVAPDASIIAYKVLDSSGSGRASSIIAAMERSLDPNQDGILTDHVDVVSMSLGGLGDPNNPLSQMADKLSLYGVITVVAAGNSGPNEKTVNSPGTSERAITVGAVSRSREIARFSSRGPVFNLLGGNLENLLKPDIVAPGVGICAAQSSQDKIRQSILDMQGSDVHCQDQQHISISGTSMATPHVAGAAALLHQKFPELWPHQVKEILKSSSTNLGFNLNSQGEGLLDIQKAIETNLVITPKIIETTATVQWNVGYGHLTFKNYGDTAMQIILSLQSNPSSMGVVFSPTTFCLEEFNPQSPSYQREVDVDLDLTGLDVGDHSVELLTQIQTLQGDCNSQPLGSSRTETIPVRVKKIYPLNVEYVPLSSPPTSGSIIRGYTLLAYKRGEDRPFHIDSKFYITDHIGPFIINSDTPEIDVILNAFTIVNTGNRNGDIIYSNSNLGKGLDLLQTSSVTLNENLATEVATNIGSDLRSRNLRQQDFYSITNFGGGISIPTWQLDATKIIESFDNMYNDWYNYIALFYGIDQNAVYDSKYNIDPQVGRLYSYRIGQQGLVPTVTKQVTLNNIISVSNANSNKKYINYYPPLPNFRRRSPIILPNYLVGDTSELTLPENDGRFSSFSRFSSNQRGERIDLRTYDRAQFSEINPTALSDLHLHTNDLSETFTGSCVNSAQFFIRDAGRPMFFSYERISPAGTLTIKNPLGVAVNGFPFNNELTLPNIAGVIEVEGITPELGFTGSRRLLGIEVSPNCIDRVILPRTCGNGIVDVGETCDDGNFVDSDGCANNCGISLACGNGRIDLGEECDGTILNGQTCNSQNFIGGGNLGCSSSCQFDTFSCIDISIRLDSISHNSLYSHCIDNDGGENFEQRGIAKVFFRNQNSLPYQLEDQCAANNIHIQERSCELDPSVGVRIGFTEVRCPNGCSDGACN